MKSWIVLASWVATLGLAPHDSTAARGVAPAAAAGAGSAPAASAPPVSTSVGPVVVARSMAHRFQSGIVDDVYEVRVAIPEDYDNDDERRPVIYVLDGQWNFTLITDIVGKLSFDGSIPDPIVVGITWAESSFQPSAERWRDFTPLPVSSVAGSGGAASFLRVLETEVFPLVEFNYRASTERVLTGGSLAGLFVSYALLERPDLFTGYIASSGATGLAAEYFDRRLAEIDPALLRDERAYFTAGALYDVEDVVTGFVADLKAVVGDNRKIVLNIVRGVGHTGNEPFAYTRGLMHAFQRPRLPLSEHFLERYEGDYFTPAIPEASDLTIEAGRGELYIVQDGQRWAEVFHAASPTHFYAEGIDIDLTFYRTEEGQRAFTLMVNRTPYELVRRPLPR